MKEVLQVINYVWESRAFYAEEYGIRLPYLVEYTLQGFLLGTEFAQLSQCKFSVNCQLH
jgi:hypothetical protein